MCWNSLGGQQYAYEAVQDLTPEVVPRCCKNSSSELIKKKILNNIKQILTSTASQPCVALFGQLLKFDLQKIICHLKTYKIGIFSFPKSCLSMFTHKLQGLFSSMSLYTKIMQNRIDASFSVMLVITLVDI